MKSSWSPAVLCLLLMVGAAWPARCPAAERSLSAEQREFFEAKIRPVLTEHCYACHNSADAAEGGLVLDHRAGWMRGGDSGKVIVPGQPDASRLLPILRHEIEGLEMPEGGPKLEAAVVEDFARWIRMGAPDPRDAPPSAEELEADTSWPKQLERRKQWWSFQPIAAVEPPPVGDSGGHPVDRFVDAALEQQQLKQSPPTDTATLVRRLYFALLGLPPSEQEALRWIEKIETAKPRQPAIEALIDSLLDSPHFGERFARHWMDWIRYAESHGSEGDPAIDNAWMYRDYLIRALNDDIPFDQLIREHLAGDLLPEPRVNESLGLNESAIGTAQLRMVFHGFAPTDALDEKVRFIDDQINVLSKAFLALTVSCARCHDHKFDAISQADYYAWFGILASCRPGRNVVDLPDIQNRNRSELAGLKQRIHGGLIDHWIASAESAAERLVESADKPQTELGQFFQRLQKQHGEGKSLAAAWTELAAAEADRLDEFERFTRSSHELSWDVAEPADADAWYRSGIGVQHHARAGAFAVSPEAGRIVDGIYPAGIYTHALSSKHPGRLTSPDFDLRDDATIWVQAIGGGNATVRYVVQDYPRRGTVYRVNSLKDRWTTERFDVSYWKGDSVHLELTTAMDAPLLTSDQPRSWFGLRRAWVTTKDQPVPQANESLSPLIDRTEDQPPNDKADLKAMVASALKEALRSWKTSELTDRQALFLDACLSEGVLPNSLEAFGADSESPLAELVQTYRRLEREIPTPRRAPGLEETVGRDQELMLRGNHKQLGEPVPRRFLEAIDREPYETEDSGRLQLAEDLLRDDNPLTRRVIVNRMWHHLFGRGLVATPDNFGRLGEKPTHPELLDWLANDFAKNGWSIKQLVRRIVTSAAWQRASVPQPGVAERDPENLYLARANVRRLEAEAIRDSLLSISGKLDASLYGPPVASNVPRRSVYVEVIRNRLDPFLRAFDFPEPFSAKGRRDATNVPAQSLALMNDAQTVEFAEGLADSMLEGESPGDRDARIRRLFLRAFSRTPSPREIAAAKDYLEQSTQLVSDRRQRRGRITRQIAELDRQIESWFDPARQRLAAQQDDRIAAAKQKTASPVAAWDFTSAADDVVGDADAELRGGAELGPEGLVVRDGGHAVSKPLAEPLSEKTLEVWLRLDDLSQRGGGAVSVQSSNGVTFDAIVFGERDPKQWLAGSNRFERTQPFGGPPETDRDAPIHVAITYAADGTITGYRNGKRYGTSYRSDGPHRFPAGQTVVGFGVRHLPAVGNRMLSGTIVSASLYSKCLSDEEIEASFTSRGDIVTEADLIAEMTPEQRTQLGNAREQRKRLAEQLDAIPEGSGGEAQQAWTELARAIFLFKEFIYVR